jgi:hypothetical protein
VLDHPIVAGIFSTLKLGGRRKNISRMKENLGGIRICGREEGKGGGGYGLWMFV